MLRLRTCTIAFLLAVFSAGLISNVYIHLSYWANMPRTPQVALDRILPIRVNHGTLVYVTRKEFDRARFVFGFGSYVTIGAGLLLAFVRLNWADPGPRGGKVPTKAASNR